MPESESEFTNELNLNSKSQLVILVDDNYFNVDVLKGLVQDDFPTYDTATAFSGEDALAIVEQCIREKNNIYACFIDVNMPEMSGCILAEKIREKYGFQNVPTLLAVTAQENPETHPDW